MREQGCFSRKGRPRKRMAIDGWPCDVNGALPEKAFMKWRSEKQNTASKYPATGSNQDHPYRKMRCNGTTVHSFDPVIGPFGCTHGVN